MQRLIFNLLTCATGILSLTACSKKNDRQEPLPSDNIHRIAVKKVSSSPTSINLDNRQSWELHVADKVYQSVWNMDGSMLATPVKDSFYFEYQGQIANAPPSTVFVYFSSPKYCKQFGPVFVKEPGPRYTPPNIFDQQTAEDLAQADLLTGSYKGAMVPEIAGLKLTHANALLNLDFTGLTKTDTVYIYDMNKPFRPYQEAADRFKAIVTGRWFGIERGTPLPLAPVKVEVRSTGKKMATVLTAYHPLPSNSKLSLLISVDRTNDTLMIDASNTGLWDN